MGCFNTTGFISQLPILGGNKVVCFIATTVNNMNDKYTVWVGGVEVNDCLLSKERAVEVANLLRKQGYDDVHVEKYYTIPPQLKFYLWQEFSKNNLPKYYKYFEQWVNNLTYNQIAYFTAYSTEHKTIWD